MLYVCYQSIPYITLTMGMTYGGQTATTALRVPPGATKNRIYHDNPGSGLSSQVPDQLPSPHWLGSTQGCPIVVPGGTSRNPRQFLSLEHPYIFTYCTITHDNPPHSLANPKKSITPTKMNSQILELLSAKTSIVQPFQLCQSDQYWWSCCCSGFCPLPETKAHLWQALKNQ